MGWELDSPWKIVSGSGQTLALTATTETHFANTVGANGQTRAVQINLAPATTAYGVLIRITGSGAAATSALDYFLKSTDPPAVLGCAPGDSVHLFPTANGTAYLCELTH